MRFLNGLNGNRGPNVAVDYTIPTPDANASEMTIRISLATDSPGVDQKVDIWDFVSGQWELVDWRDSTDSDVAYTNLTLVLKDDPKKYMDLWGENLTGQIKIRVSWEEPTSTFPRWSAFIDQLVVDTIGN